MSDYFCYTAINTLLQNAALCVIDTPQKLYGKVLTSSKRERMLSASAVNHRVPVPFVPPHRMCARVCEC